MKRFTHGRVKVTEQGHPLQGKQGRVERLRMCDDGAWVTMDEDLPEDLVVFPAGDERHRNVLLYPDQCEPLALEKAMKGR